MLMEAAVEFVWWGLHSQIHVQPNYSVEVVLRCAVVGVVTIIFLFCRLLQYILSRCYHSIHLFNPLILTGWKLSQIHEGIPQPGWNKIFLFVGTFPCILGQYFARDSWARWVLLLRVTSNHILPEKIIFNQRKIVPATIDYFPVSRNDFLS